MASIKQLSDRKYKITISNGYRPNGKKICKAKTITVPNSVKPRGISQYVAHEAEELERLVKSGFAEDRDTTFEAYATRWLERQVKYAPGTLASYRRMLGRVYPYIGAIKLGELRPMALENLLIELRKRTHQGKPIQEATVQKYLTVVSAVLSDAKRNEIISKNPARMIDLPDTEQRQQFIPTDEQAQDLILALLDEPYHYKLFYVLAMYTGCRRGELCALRWNDFVIVEKYRSVLTVSRSRTVVVGQGVVEGPTKNGRSRTIALSEDMTSLVQGFFYYQREIAEQHGRKLSPYLFVNEKGNPIHPDTFTKHLRQIFEERRNYLLEVCRREFGDWGVFSSGEQGMHVVFTFKNQNIDDHAVQRLCLEQGVETRHLSSFYHEQPPLKGLVLGFGFFNESQILSAVSRIGFVLRHNFSAWA